MAYEETLERVRALSEGRIRLARPVRISAMGRGRNGLRRAGAMLAAPLRDAATAGAVQASDNILRGGWWDAAVQRSGGKG